MWIYNGKKFESRPNGVVGFVYVIRNNDTNQKYIGKKKLSSYSKGKGWFESNWKEYQSSSEIVQKWTNVTKVVICLCFTDTELTYMEIHHQIHSKALLRDDYVNYCIGDGIKIGRIPDYMRCN